MPRKLCSLWLAIALLVPLPAGCTRKDGGGARQPRQSAAVPVVQVFILKRQRPSRQLKLPGELAPYESVDVVAKAEGFVADVAVDKGSIVKRGQPLARIVAPELLAQTAEARSRFQSAQAERAQAEAAFLAQEGTYERMRSAAKVPGVIAPNELATARAAAEGARARVRSLEGSIAAAHAELHAKQDVASYLQVTAPFDGVVTARYIHPGALVGPSGAGAKPLFHLASLSRLRLVLDVPEADTQQVVAGQTLQFTVPAFPDRTFSGVIRRLPHAIEEQTRTEPIELDVANPSGRLAPGMYAEASWVVRPAQASFYVPTSAVVTTTEATFVVRVENGRVEWVDVKQGASAGDRVEVFGNLREGDQLALKGTDELRKGSQVKAQLASGTSTR